MARSKVNRTPVAERPMDNMPPIARKAGIWIETQDEQGNMVKVRMPDVQDFRYPKEDEDGTVPEFVNISGKTQNLCIVGQPHDTLVVPPFGIVRGAQWRHYAERNKAWGEVPYFMERQRNKEGEFDPKYLLTIKQLTDLIARVNIPVNPDNLLAWLHKLAIKRMQGFLENGKVQVYNEATGQPTLDKYDVVEDRSEVTGVLRRKIADLEANLKAQEGYEFGTRK